MSRSSHRVQQTVSFGVTQIRFYIVLLNMSIV